jgi:thiamine biosynthesis lipoprotein
MMAITELIVPGRYPAAARDRRSDSSCAGSSSADSNRADSNQAAATWTASWTVWGTRAYVTVTDPAALPAARRLVSRQFAAVEKAAARFRRDAELHRLYRAGGRTITVSPLLAGLISAALITAERTGGDVDPTVGAAMTAVACGSAKRDRSGIPVCGTRPTQPRPVPGWERVNLDGRRLQVPAGTTLDLSVTAKAVACDHAAAGVRERLDVGVLVGLGGNVATAGPAPEGGWYVEIEDRTGNRLTAATLSAGAALATSHLTAHTRPEMVVNAELGTPGHLIDPHTGRAPTPVWRMATAIGFSSLEMAAYTAASLVRGTSARAWLGQLWVPARLVTIYGDVITVGPWQAHDPGEPSHKALEPQNDAVPIPRLANPQRTTL